MGHKRNLGYDAYDILPNSEKLADLLGDSLEGEGEVGYGGGELTDIPDSLLSQGKVTLGQDGIEVNSDNDFLPTLENLEYSHDLTFSHVDDDTVQWSSGTLTFSDGQSFSISAGNTGNMSSRTYIYFDKNASTTVLQTTTTASGAAGSDRVMIAVAQNGSGSPTWQVFGGAGGLKINASQMNLANNRWIFTGTFTATDSNTVAWSSGTLTTSDGTTFNISAGNTGNMSALTYIYFNLGLSATLFHTTTTAANVVGDGKILICVAEDGTNEASFQVMNSKDSKIVAANIVAGAITANEIAAGTITAAKMNVTTLSAIAADMGTITAGTITLNSSGYIRGGQTGYDTGIGFFLGYSGGAYKFSIGNASGNRLTWDGSSLVVKGTVADVQTFTSSGTWTKPSGGSMAFIQAWGGGGSGGLDTGGTNPTAGGGGGGGYTERWIPISDLGSTETVTIGSGGAARVQAGGTAAGATGGTTSFGSHVVVYGGGGGDANGEPNGGGGGSAIGAGGTYTAGGLDAGVGGEGSTRTDAGDGTTGGSGGGFGDAGSSPGYAGNALYGGAGGGGAGGGARDGGTSRYGGDGGAGSDTVNVSGGDGDQPGGGGGGHAQNSSTGSSGAGGDGKVVVTVI